MDDIFYMIREGNALAVRLWLDSIDNDINQCDDHGFSLLHWACWDGRLHIVEMLVNRGIKLNLLNKCEDTPLHCAVRNNHFDVALFLLRNKFNANAMNIHGNMPLHYACHFGFNELVLELIRNGAVINQANRYGKTPLDLANNELKSSILNFARNEGYDLTRQPFKEDSGGRLSSKIMKNMSYQGTSINIDDLPVERMIDANHGGTSWKGYWQNTEVVIKVLKLKESVATPRVANTFNQECKKLRVFNSTYILPVLGACTSLPDLILVSQYLPLGSLFNLLHEQAEIVLDHNQSVNFAHHIAKGMDWLHNNLDNSIVANFHLNSKHIMIDSDLTAKINMADYKFSFMENDKIYSPAWMAPEEFKKRPDQVNKKSCDMWSFGVVLWELFTREVPFGEYSPIQCGMLIAKGALKLNIPPSMSNHVSKLIRICMNDDPVKRPKFDMLIPILEKLKNSTGDSAPKGH